MAGPPSLVLPVTELFGPVYICIILAAVLFGISCLQTLLYYMNYPKDQLWVKSLVGTIFVLDLAHMLCIVIGFYWYFISHFGDEADLLVLNGGFKAQSYFSATVIFLVHCFFTLRVYRFTQNIPVLVVLSLFVLATFGTALALAAILSSFATVVQFEAHINKSLDPAGRVLIAVTDTVLAVMLVYYLQRDKQGSKSTQSMIAMLIKYTIATGALTSVVAIVGFVTALALPSTNNTAAGVYYLLSKLYANALLSTLNSRQFINRVNTSAGVMEMSTVQLSSSATAPAIAVESTDMVFDNSSIQKPYDSRHPQHRIVFAQPTDKSFVSQNTTAAPTMGPSYDRDIDKLGGLDGL